jgi:hypothetical protein
MTDPAVLNFNVDLVGCERAQRKFERLQFAFGFGRSQRALELFPLQSDKLEKRKRATEGLIRRKFPKDHVCFFGLRR